jgi:hypothetical protein
VVLTNDLMILVTWKAILVMLPCSTAMLPWSRHLFSLWSYDRNYRNNLLYCCVTVILYHQICCVCYLSWIVHCPYPNSHQPIARISHYSWYRYCCWIWHCSTGCHYLLCLSIDVFIGVFMLDFDSVTHLKLRE